MTVNKNYYDDLSKIGGLSEDELIQLFEDYNNGNQKAYNKLIEGNLKLVIHFGKKYWNVIKDDRMIEFEDLVSEGNIGLIQAINKFQIDKNIKFSYYASFWINKMMIKFINKHTEIPIESDEIIDYPDELFELDELSPKLIQAINELSPKKQFIIKMLFGIGQDKSYKINEIALMLNTKRQYVYQLKMAAYKNLKDRLKNEL